jgi:hypothetical protein
MRDRMGRDDEAAVPPQGKEKSCSPDDESNSSTTQSQEDSSEYVTGLELWGVLGAVTLACFLMSLDTSIIGTASTRIG